MAGEEKYGTKAIIALLADVKNKISDIEKNAINKKDFKELTDKVTAIEQQLDTKEDVFSPGEGLEMTEDRILNITLDTEIFWVNVTLPDTPPVGKSNKILLVPNASSTDEGNYYTEYIWVVDTEHPDGHYEELGTYKSDVDLNTYQTKTDNNLQTTDKTIVGSINEVNSKLGYFINAIGLYDDSSSEEISEAIGGYDNLLNAINNKIPIYSFISDNNNPILLNIPYIYGSNDTIKFVFYAGSEAHVYKITNNNGVLSCKTLFIHLQEKSDYNLNTTSKEIVGAINEVNDKIQVYTIVPELTADYTIPANATTREYIYEISIGATKYNVTAAEGIKWIDNNLPLVEANSKLIVSVVNNIAVWGTVYE